MCYMCLFYTKEKRNILYLIVKIISSMEKRVFGSGTDIGV